MNNREQPTYDQIKEAISMFQRNGPNEKYIIYCSIGEKNKDNEVNDKNNKEY